MAATDALDYSEEGGVYNDYVKGWEWFDEEGRYHRDGDRPAAIYDSGSLFWYQHGEPHRLGGYASIYASCMYNPEWWVNGKRFMTKHQFEKARDSYCETHGIPPTTGRLTKRAAPS